MTIELTEAQRQAIASAADMPPRLVDSAANVTYVLLRADIYERLERLLDDEYRPSAAYPAIDRAFAAGWDDPKMSEYDRYEELKR
jgi:hypothetical protein